MVQDASGLVKHKAKAVENRLDLRFILRANISCRHQLEAGVLQWQDLKEPKNHID